MQKSKACPFAIAKGKNPNSGNVTWKIPQNVPTGTYFIRALVYAKNASDPTGNSDTPVAFGDSKGFFQVPPPSTHTPHPNPFPLLAWLAWIAQGSSTVILCLTQRAAHIQPTEQW